MSHCDGTRCFASLASSRYYFRTRTGNGGLTGSVGGSISTVRLRRIAAVGILSDRFLADVNAVGSLFEKQSLHPGEIGAKNGLESVSFGLSLRNCLQVAPHGPRELAFALQRLAEAVMNVGRVRVECEVVLEDSEPKTAGP